MVCSLLRGPWSVTWSALSAADFVGSGCSLRLILEWAWEKAAEIKAAVDKLCE